MRAEAQLTTVMIVGDYEASHYSWNSREQKALGNPKGIGEVIIKRLEAKGCKVDAGYVIEHEPENYKYFDDTPFDINNDKKHFHLILYFSNEGKKYTLGELADFVGMNRNYLAKGKTGRFTWNNMLSYLVHIKYEDKIQYPPHLVFTIVGRDYQEVFKENQRQWLDGRVAINRKNEVNPTKKKLDKMLKKAVCMIENFEMTADELSRDPKYIILFKKPDYVKKIDKAQEAIDNLILRYRYYLYDEICNGNIKCLDDIKKDKMLYITYQKYPDYFSEIH